MTDSGAILAAYMAGPWWPGPKGLGIWTKNTKIGGDTKLFDIRGWGHLTGGGHGALGLPEAEAIEIQKAYGRLAAAAPELLTAAQNGLVSMQETLECIYESHCLLNDDLTPRKDTLDKDVRDLVAGLEAKIEAARAAIAKATGVAS